MSGEGLLAKIDSKKVERMRSHYVTRNLSGSLKLIWEEGATRYSFLFILFLVFLAVFGPSIIPYDYNETQYGEDGDILIAAPPSLGHPLGTTTKGYDVLSRLIYGARPTVLAGFLGGTIIISIGMTIGLISGYIGGQTDDALMRLTDMAYSIPMIPFAIVLVALFGVGFLMSILIIGIILWRSSARIIRAQVLQIKEREFILAAKATGASRSRIILKHILPNVAPMAVLFFALNIGYTIIIQASLAFIGVTTPFIPSWGIMLRNVNSAALMSTAWWWSLPPGIMLSLTVISAFMFSRGYERASSGTERETLREA